MRARFVPQESRLDPEHILGEKGIEEYKNPAPKQSKRNENQVMNRGILVYLVKPPMGLENRPKRVAEQFDCVFYHSKFLSF